MSGRRPLPLAARRSFRLAASTSLALALAYGFGLGIPFLAPLFAVLLGATPGPPPGPRQLLVLMLVLVVTLGVGIALGPLLQQAPVAALLIISLGLWASNTLALNAGKEIPATLLALGFTVIPAAGTLSPQLASTLIAAMVLGVAVAVFCQWLVYPLFPEDAGTPEAVSPPAPAATSGWQALRATLIVLPAFLFTLTNPLAYLPLTVKSILLGREANTTNLRRATAEMLGATALGGICAMAVWLCLGLAVELWFFTGWMLLASLPLAAGAYGVWRTRLSPPFWINTLTTLLILLGAAVQDSANGKDVYQAFAVRMALFFAITVYALLAMAGLEQLRLARHRRGRAPALSPEVS